MVVILAGALLGAGCTRSTLQVRSLPAAAQPPSAALEPTNEPSPAPAPPPEFPLAVASPLDCAIEAARKSGKPVLVIVTGPEVRAQRGRWLTDLLMLDGNGLYAQLALVEVAFATKRELLAVLPTELHASAQLCEAVLVDVLEDAPEFVSLLESSTCEAMADGPDSVDYCSGLRTLGAELEQRLFIISQRTALARQRIARSRLTTAQLHDLELALADVHRADSDVAVCAAWCFHDSGLYGEGRWSDGGPEGWRMDIVNTTRAEWEQQAPYGARWAQFDGVRWQVQALPGDDERELQLLEARARDVDPRAIWLSTVIESFACNGPCGTGYSSRVACSFLDEYTRVLVDATDLD